NTNLLIPTLVLKVVVMLVCERARVLSDLQIVRQTIEVSDQDLNTTRFEGFFFDVVPNDNRINTRMPDEQVTRTTSETTRDIVDWASARSLVVDEIETYWEESGTKVVTCFKFKKMDGGSFLENEEGKTS